MLDHVEASKFIAKNGKKVSQLVECAFWRKGPSNCLNKRTNYTRTFFFFLSSGFLFAFQTQNRFFFANLLALLILIFWNLWHKNKSSFFEEMIFECAILLNSLNPHRQNDFQYNHCIIAALMLLTKLMERDRKKNIHESNA